MPERLMDGGEILVEVLNANSIEYIIGSPGSEWAPMWEALSRRMAKGEKAPRYVNCRHESLAVGAASGYHRATGRLPAVTLHAAPGSLNCATNLRGALHNGTPMLVIAGESMGYGEMDGPDPGAQWLHGLTDVGGTARLVEPFVKWAITVQNTHTLTDTFHRACQIAMTPPQGPVFVSVPVELMLQKIPLRDIPLPPMQAIPQADTRALETVARLILDAQHPVVFTESAGKTPDALGYLVELAETLSIPVVESSAPECTNFPTNHPLHQGYDPQPHLANADIILLVASSNPWHPPSKGPDPRCKIIYMGPDPNHTLKAYSGYSYDMCLPGNVAINLKALVRIARNLKSKDDTKQKERTAKLHEIHSYNREVLQQQAYATMDKHPIDPRWLCYALNQTLPDNTIVCDELVVHRGILDRYLDRNQPGGYMHAFGGLGQGLPNALGLKLAMPKRLVVAVLGDGSFFYNPVVSSYGLCQQYDIPILTIIFNNHGYRVHEGSLGRLYPEGFAIKGGADGLAISITPRPHYPKLVEAFGGWGLTVDRPEEIIPAILQGIKTVNEGRPALLDVSLAW
jgi:acetolactate synthase-1/2/3 large subunit